jgi:hypothetical protein
VIIDCDTHLMPRDAFDRIDGRYREIKPTLKFDPGGRMKFEDVRLLRDNPKISEEAKELIRWKNAKRLFNLAV